MAEEKDEFEEIENKEVNKVFYGPQFLYDFILKHKEELGLPKNFKIDTGKRYSGVLFPIRDKVYNQFRKTYTTPHLNHPIIESGRAIANNIKLNKIIKGKEDKIYKLMVKEGLPLIYKFNEEIKLKIENKKDFDDLLKTPKEFNNVVNHEIKYNLNKITKIISDLNEELSKSKEITGGKDEIEQELKKLKKKKDKTEEEMKRANILENTKNDIKKLNGEIKTLEKEIEKANEYKKSLEEKYNKYLENKDKIKAEKEKYKAKLEEERANIETEYNKKLQNIEKQNVEEIEKIKQKADITAKEKEKEIKDLENKHNKEIEKINNEKEEAEEKYYAKINELEENKHNIDFLEKKIEEIDKENKTKDKIISDQKEEIEEKREAVAYQSSKRHEAEVELKHTRDELKNKDEQPKPTYQPSNTPPTLKDYIKDKVINKSYSLEKDELIKVIEKDIDEHRLPKDIDVSKLADTIYLQGAKYINKHMEKIKSLVKLTGYDNDLYNKLPSELAGEIQKYIHDKALEDIRKKNIRYILPKEMPRWEKAVNKGINPMLGRGAWSK